MALAGNRIRSIRNARPWRLCVEALLCVLVLAQTSAAEPDEALISETQIKAAFIYNFTKFVEWPAAKLPPKGAALVIGVLGETPLSAELTAIVAGRKVNGRPIEVRSVHGAEDVAAIQMLFVSAPDEARFVALGSAVVRDAVLTVGESPEFAAANGAIVFVRLNGKLRFEINMSVAERAGLKISGELQKLAAAVRRTP